MLMFTVILCFTHARGVTFRWMTPCLIYAGRWVGARAYPPYGWMVWERYPMRLFGVVLLGFIRSMGERCRQKHRPQVAVGVWGLSVFAEHHKCDALDLCGFPVALVTAGAAAVAGVHAGSEPEVFYAGLF